MALEIHWYDSICFSIVVISVLGALYALRLKENQARTETKSSNSKNESLLVSSAGTVDISVIDDECVNSLSHVGYCDLWSSCYKGLNPFWLLGLRIFAFVVLCGFLVWDIQEWGLSIFLYYTEWTFTLVIIYFAVGTVISAHGCVLYYTKKKDRLDEFEDREDLLKDDVEQNNILSSGNGGEGGNDYCNRNLQSQLDGKENNEIACFWGYLMQTLYQTCAGAVILTDVVFWSVIVPFLSSAHLQVDVLSCSMHTVNGIFLLLDTSLNNLPFPWFRFGYFVLWSCSYVIFQWIIHACGFTWWPYPFLDMSTPAAPFWYFCMAAVHIPCYGIYTLLVKAKRSIILHVSLINS
ncbi:hypothetical protein LIER_10731 [Lithospermum erythrorhizon]|uniref:Uncharacterized protein n=1 Tax=Lithospermum erythrorhizon TaxID=34254 RepID=A0AAV3PLP2_LITER